LKKLFAEHDFGAVIHFAGYKAVGESIAMPIKYYRNNMTGSMNLMEAMEEAGVKNLVFSSSATVYGETKYLPIDEKHPIGQGLTNPYGKSKYFIEEMCRDYANANTSWNIVRPSPSLSLFANPGFSETMFSHLPPYLSPTSISVWMIRVVPLAPPRDTHTPIRHGGRSPTFPLSPSPSALSFPFAGFILLGRAHVCSLLRRMVLDLTCYIWLSK
jgi:hypothetical protein